MLKYTEIYIYIIQVLITVEASRVLYRKGAVIEVAGLLKMSTYGF